MGVFSDIPEGRLAADLAAWERGRLVSAQPTPHGIENSNFFVTLCDPYGNQSQWVLTVMESPPESTGLEVLAHLDDAGLPVAAPVPDARGQRVGRVAGWPALLCPRLEGTHPEHPDPVQCRALGAFLGRMHHHTADLDGPEHPRDLDWMEAGWRQHRGMLTDADARRLRRTLDALAAVARRRDHGRLPTGVVHGDLFRDNALMQGTRLTGVIDFHHAARAPLAFDLAVAVNDWCVSDARLDPVRMNAMVEGYHAQRPLDVLERLYWPVLMVLAATRFWLARLASPRKPPEEMAAHLAHYLDAPPWLHPDICRLPTSPLRPGGVGNRRS